MPRKPRVTPPANGLSKWAWELRLQHGLTQQQFADRAGLERETIADWERDKSAPDGRSVEKVAKAFGVRPHTATSNGAVAHAEPPPARAHYEPGVPGLQAAIAAWAREVDPALIDDADFFTEVSRAYTAHRTRAKAAGPPISQSSARRHGSSR